MFGKWQILFSWKGKNEARNVHTERRKEISYVPVRWRPDRKPETCRFVSPGRERSSRRSSSTGWIGWRCSSGEAAPASAAAWVGPLVALGGDRGRVRPQTPLTSSSGDFRCWVFCTFGGDEEEHGGGAPLRGERGREAGEREGERGGGEKKWGSVARWGGILGNGKFMFVCMQEVWWVPFCLFRFPVRRWYLQKAPSAIILFLQCPLSGV